MLHVYSRQQHTISSFFDQLGFLFLFCNISHELVQLCCDIIL